METHLRKNENLLKELKDLQIRYDHLKEDYISKSINAKEDALPFEAHGLNWKSITEYSANHIMLLDINYIIKFVNHTIPELNKHDLLEKSIFDYVSEDHKPLALETYEKVKAIKTTESYESFYRTDEGHIVYFDVQISPLTNDEGELIGFINTSSNITAAKEAELKLKEKSEEIEAQNEELKQANDELYSAIKRAEISEARLNLALETSRTGTWDLDLKDHSTTRTLLHDQIFGYPDLLPKWTLEMFLDHVYDKDKAYVEKSFWEARRTESNLRFECRIKRIDGKIRWISVLAKHILNSENKSIHMSGVVQDITDLKTSEIVLKEKTEEIEAQNEELRQANDELYEVVQRAEESEERYDLAMDANHDGLFDWKLVDNTIYYSPGWKKMLGYLDHEIPNDFSVWEKLTQKEDIEKSWSLQQKLIAKEIERFVIEFKMQHKDGHWVDILSRAKAIFDSEGRAVRIVGTHTDISERKLMNLKLRDSQNNLSAIFNNTLEPQLLSKHIGDKTFVIVAVNQAYLSKLKGLGLNISEGDLVGENLKKVILELLYLDEEVYDYTINYYLQAIKEKQLVKIPESIEIEGNAYYSETSYIPIFNSEDGCDYLLYQSHDVTQLTESVKMVEKSEERFALAVQGSNDGIWDWSDLESDEYWWSDRVYEMLGYKVGEVEARISHWYKWMHSDDSEKVLKALKQHFELREPYQVEFRMKKKDGQYVWLFVRGESVRNEEGKPIRMAGSLSDISEQKRIEEDLITAKENAEESDRLKSAFLANMSHEIRTPMNGILGFAELLKKPKLTGEKQEKYVNIIQKSGKRMLNIINDIVDISKIEAGLMKVELEPSNINEQMEYIHTFFKPEVDAKGLGLSFKSSLSSEESIILTDREKLFAILTNLVKNAIKYTEKGEIEFGYYLIGTEENPYLKFFVKDTGIGIPEDRLKAIFERFIQADIVDKLAMQGAGLGLSISKSFVTILGGEIWAESHENLGSTFFFTIPFNTPEANLNEVDFLPENSEHLTLNDSKKLKVLIAEDDDASEELVAIMVEDISQKILKARNGLEVVQMCRENEDLDLILMDIRMPQLDGYSATQQIREFNKEVIIIAQTAYGLSGDKEKALEAGCNAYLSKPIDKTELFDLIEKSIKV